MTPQQRAAAIAAQAHAKERAAAADMADKRRNRRLMPLTAAFVDQFTAIFGKPPSGMFTEGDPPRTVKWGRYK